ncbi:MAG: hypothetical protein KTR14_04640 [Vampirovibrio sp.]|nr:hypothetical protein [Vampirovibrio sp.]
MVDAEETTTPQSESVTSENAASESSATDRPDGDEYAEFEVGEHQVPWFLWLFFTLIILWASVSWIKFYGY